MDSDGEHSFQISSLESIQALMKHAALLSRTLSPPNKIEKKQWAKKNAPILLAQLEQLMPGLFPKVLWNLIFEYEPITWIVV